MQFLKQSNPWKVLAIEVLLIGLYLHPLAPADLAFVVILSIAALYRRSPEFLVRIGLLALFASGAAFLISPKWESRPAEIAAALAFYLLSSALLVSGITYLGRGLPGLARRLAGVRLRSHVAPPRYGRASTVGSRLTAGLLFVAIGIFQLYQGGIAGGRLLTSLRTSRANPEIAQVPKQWRSLDGGGQRIAVAINDSTGTDQLAPRVTAMLRARGFRVIRVRKSDPLMTESIVRYRAGRLPAAKRLAESLPFPDDVTYLATSGAPAGPSGIDVTLGTPPSSASASVADPRLDSINIAVLNGSGLPRDAAATAAKLKPKGYQVTRIANADDMERPTTSITYRPGQLTQAKAVKLDLADRHPILRPEPGATKTIVVVLGRDRR